MFKLQDFVEDLRWIKLETPSVAEAAAVTRSQSGWDRNGQLNVDAAIAQHITGARADDNGEDITDARIQVEDIKAGLANYEPIHGWPPKSFWVRLSDPLHTDLTAPISPFAAVPALDLGSLACRLASGTLLVALIMPWWRRPAHL